MNIERTDVTYSLDTSFEGFSAPGKMIFYLCRKVAEHFYLELQCYKYIHVAVKSPTLLRIARRVRRIFFKRCSFLNMFQHHGQPQVSGVSVTSLL